MMNAVRPATVLLMATAMVIGRHIAVMMAMAMVEPVPANAVCLLFDENFCASLYAFLRDLKRENLQHKYFLNESTLRLVAAYLLQTHAVLEGHISETRMLMIILTPEMYSDTVSHFNAIFASVFTYLHPPTSLYLL